MAKVPSGLWLRGRWESMGFGVASLARRSRVSRSTITRLAAGGRLSQTIGALLAKPLELTPAALDALLASAEVDEGEMARLVNSPE